MRRQHGFWGVILFSISFCIASFGTQAANLGIVFSEDFESGQGDWVPDNGVWQVGMPSAGPPSCTGGTDCAGTIRDVTVGRLCDLYIANFTVPVRNPHKPIYLAQGENSNV
jgi:hypothetical protein